MGNGNVYWHLPQLARVDGKPKMTSERYLGSAKDIEKLLDAMEAGDYPGENQTPGIR